MNPKILGTDLENLISTAQHHVVFVAPFIKKDALRRALAAIPEGVQKIDCVTRWRPEDIVDGVCDLEIYDVIEGTSRARLWRQTDLHAKYFRSDTRCLVGSANLTGKALGWRLPSNLELLVELESGFPGLREWEDSLFEESTVVTSELRDDIAKKVEELKADRPPRRSVDVETDTDPDYKWMPMCPSPEKLFGVYSGTIDAGKMVQSAYDLACRDLVTLGPPSGFTEASFKAFVGKRLKNLDVIGKVNAASELGLTDAQAALMLFDYIDPSFEIDPGDVWKILKRWMMYFYPEDFRVEVGQEVLVKSRQISFK